VLQLWNTTPAFRQIGKLLRSVLKPVEDSERVVETVVGNEANDFFKIRACGFGS